MRNDCCLAAVPPLPMTGSFTPLFLMEARMSFGWGTPPGPSIPMEDEPETMEGECCTFEANVGVRVIRSKASESPFWDWSPPPPGTGDIFFMKGFMPPKSMVPPELLTGASLARAKLEWPPPVGARTGVPVAAADATRHVIKRRRRRDAIAKVLDLFDHFHTLLSPTELSPNRSVMVLIFDK